LPASYGAAVALARNGRRGAQEKQARACIECALNNSLEFLGPGCADLAALRPRLLRGQVLLGHVAERTVEHRHVMLDAETHIGVMIERALARGIDVVRLKGIGLVAVGLRQFDAAIDRGGGDP
jgi:LDH2 family malate/lactate/ureidoglycolate dehydrogenase